MNRRHVVAATLALFAAQAHAGAFLFSDGSTSDDVIVHPHNYTGAGGPQTVTVCIDPASTPGGSVATFEASIQKVIATWNAQRAATQNIGLGTESDLANGSQVDLESTVLHEVGHCLGLAHVNHASESGLPNPQINGTKSTVGTNAAFDQGAGVDTLHGSRDDLRVDDVNLYWYQRNSNLPLDFPAIVDTTTFARVGFLPAGHLFAQNADRDVMNALGLPRTESAMQQGAFGDEAQRRLTGEDLATLKLGMAGLDGVQGTSDDYTVQLAYAGQTTACNIPVSFDPGTFLAFCSAGGSFLNANHVRLSGTFISLGESNNWFYSAGANTTTTITADSPDASSIGQAYTVTASVVKNANGAAITGDPTGSVEITDGAGATCTGTLAATVASCALTSTIAGAKTLTATYLGFRGFDVSSDTEPHNVTAASTTTAITADPTDPSVVGQAYPVTVSVSSGSGTPTGTVGVADGTGATCTVTLSGGTGSCNLTSTTAGAKSLTATYSAQAGFGASSDTEPHTVNAAGTTLTITSDSPDASVVGQSVTVAFTLAANAPGAGTPTGNVVVTVSGGAETCTATLPATSCALTLTVPGARTLTASYAATANFGASSDTEGHQVNPAGTTLTITSDNPDASVVGQAVTVAFTLAVNAPGAGTPTGNVVVTASGGAETCTATLPATSCALTLVAAGSRTLTASYAGTGSFGGSNDTEGHTVNTASTTLAITSDNPDASVVGQSVTVAFTLAVTAPGAGTPTGNVVVTVSGGAETCTATLPATSCALALTSAGARTLTASYAGSTNFGASSDTEAHTVNAAATTLAIATDNADPSVVGESITVAFTLSVTAPGGGSPTGDVVVTASGGSETCTATLPATSCALALTATGARTITASYAGNASFGASSDTEAHTVNAAGTSLTITSDDPDPSVMGQSVTVGFTLAVNAPGAGTPTGNIVVTASGGAETCTATLPATSCALTLTTLGSRTLTASYAGTGSFGASNDTETHIVNSGSTTLAITSDNPDASVVGQAVTVAFTLAVNPPGTGTPAGNVVVTASGGAETCTAILPATSCALTLTVPGARTLTASYAGNASFGASSDTEAHAVNAASTTLAIASDNPDASVVGQPVTVAFTLGVNAPGAGTPTGNVVVTASGGSETCTATLPATSCALALASAGARTLTATYAGTASFAASSDTEAHTVNAASTTLAISAGTPDPSATGQTVTFTFQVTVDSPGAGAATGDVVVTASGGSETCTATLPATSCALALAATGARTITASYAGNASFGASSDTESHVVSAGATTTTIVSRTLAPASPGVSVTVTVAVAPVAPAAGVPGGTVTVSASASESCTIVLPATSCTLVLTTLGERTLSAAYAGDARFTASTSPGVNVQTTGEDALFQHGFEDP